MRPKVKNILQILKNEGLNINLKNIQQKYFDIYKVNLSLMTFSRILRFHLNMHFLKSTVKNPKLRINKYNIMKFFFIKGITRAINQGLKFIYLDETGFQLANNNYYDWRRINEDIYGGAKNNLQKKINFILAVDEKKVIHYKFTTNSINQNIFIDFLKEMNEKLSIQEMKNYVIIMDNAKYHTTNRVKKYAYKKKMKIITNCPYYSQFNSIEFIFGVIKKKLYRILIKNIGKLKKQILDIINHDNFQYTITKIYLKGLKIYEEFITNNNDVNLNILFNNLNIAEKK